MWTLGSSIDFVKILLGEFCTHLFTSVDGLSFCCYHGNGHAGHSWCFGNRVSRNSFCDLLGVMLLVRCIDHVDASLGSLFIPFGTLDLPRFYGGCFVLFRHVRPFLRVYISWSRGFHGLGLSAVNPMMILLGFWPEQLE